MANWRYRIDLSEIFKDFRDGKITVSESAYRVSRILWDLAEVAEKDGHDIYELEQVAEDMEGLGTYGSTEEEFDSAMDDLYDWGDTLEEPYDAWPRNRLCAVTTF